MEKADVLAEDGLCVVAGRVEDDDTPADFSPTQPFEGRDDVALPFSEGTSEVFFEGFCVHVGWELREFRKSR